MKRATSLLGGVVFLCILKIFLLHFSYRSANIIATIEKTIPKLWNRGVIPLRYGHRDDEPFPYAIGFYREGGKLVLTLSRDTCFGGSMEN